ncbi:Mfa1 family fimbria major subunit [Bacteroides uniformis]|uniref:Mfa1 family fimbria major subunit n=1 Tax=Bacteroides uniformis TaxID=820 RepID=UPI00233F5757|nr:Mfa1 family fimbria major subunit [Bacteroides uniformis]MDC1809071.1 Mfa1 family fimbria major subunit [Bacteroides uniformis]
MKLKSIFVSMFALAALASCSNDDEVVNNLPSEVSTGAYLSLAVNMPQSTHTRATGDAGPGESEGTADEQKATSALVVGLLKDMSVAVYDLTTAEIGTPGVNNGKAAAGDAFQVSPDLQKIFVVINPSAATRTQMVGATAMNQIFNVIEEEVGKVTTANNFMMTSDGSKGDGAWVAVSPSIAASDKEADLNAAKDAAKAAPCEVEVDRVAAKATLTAFVKDPTNVVNGDASVDGFLLNTTNKTFLPYAELVPYLLNGTAVTDAVYRKDFNWTALSMNADGTGDAANAFNWLHNFKLDAAGKKIPADNVWKNPATSEYCHENTMEAAAQDYNNTTKMVIKAKFAPTGVDLGTSWFRVGGVIMTFEQLNASYAKASEGDKLKYSAFLNKLLGSTRTIGWTGEGKATDVTLDDLDKIDNGGYLAATVENQNNTNMYLIEYFQKSVCYYDINIKHDNRVAAKELGRWGMVRNNWYTLGINKISKPGKPYIPDPTDPDITDPTNPDPEHPTPDDQDNAFISVSISVNNWTTWSQGVDL